MQRSLSDRWPMSKEIRAGGGLCSKINGLAAVDRRPDLGYDRRIGKTHTCTNTQTRKGLEMSRYKVYHMTERLQANNPEPFIPAQPIRGKGSGVFDLRRPDGSVLYTDTAYSFMRKLQANYNTYLVLG